MADGLKTRISFKGDGMDLFALMLKNMFLTMFTFGIYHFWAKIALQQFFNRNARFGDEPFDFHGTGKEKFIGFLKAAGIGIVLLAAGYVITIPLGMILGKMTAASLVTLLLYAAMLAFVPMILAGKRRYLLSRSSWRGVRFIFTGSWKKLAVILLKGIFLSAVTLGIYTPWFIHSYRSFMIANSCFGTERFVFSGERGSFVKLFYKGLLLSVITFGLYSFWMRASIERYFWNNTSIQGKKLSCDLTGRRFFSTSLINLLLVFFTLGLGAAWALVRLYRVWFGSIAVEGELDFEAIKADFDARASAFADGLTDAADAFDALSGFFG